MIGHVVADQLWSCENRAGGSRNANLTGSFARAQMSRPGMYQGCESGRDAGHRSHSCSPASHDLLSLKYGLEPSVKAWGAGPAVHR